MFTVILVDSCLEKYRVFLLFFSLILTTHTNKALHTYIHYPQLNAYSVSLAMYVCRGTAKLAYVSTYTTKYVYVQRP